MIRRPSGTITIIAINVIIFFIPQLIQGLDMKMLAWFALFFPKNDFFEIWQFISSMFMHGGPAHLFFNMFALFSFGSILEVRWGLKKFLTFYLVVGIGAGAIYTAVNYAQFIAPYNQLVDASVPATDIKAYFNYSRPSFKMLAAMPAEELLELRNIYNTPVVGASGAIYGILVAFGILYPNAKLMLIFLPIPVAAKYFIGGNRREEVSHTAGMTAQGNHPSSAITATKAMEYQRTRRPFDSMRQARQAHSIPLP